MWQPVPADDRTVKPYRNIADLRADNDFGGFDDQDDEGKPILLKDVYAGEPLPE